MRPTVPVRHAHQLLCMTSPTPIGAPDRGKPANRTPDRATDAPPSSHDRPADPSGRGSGWLVALLAIPVLCCAGPGLLAAIGITSLSAGVALTAGSVALTVAGCALVAAAVGLVVRRRRRQAQRGWRAGSVNRRPPGSLWSSAPSWPAPRTRPWPSARARCDQPSSHTATTTSPAFLL